MPILSILIALFTALVSPSMSLPEEPSSGKDIQNSLSLKHPDDVSNQASDPPPMQKVVIGMGDNIDVEAQRMKLCLRYSPRPEGCLPRIDRR